MELLILPSPLLPELVYEPLAKALQRRGVAARIARTGPVSAPYEVIDRWAGQAAGECALLAHSNAGFLAPSVRARAGTAMPVVFMDAALPPAAGEAPLAPAGMLDRLASLADPVTGLLPPWTRWWSSEELADVIPAPLFDKIDRACPRVPCGWFMSRVTSPANWTEEPNGYLAFGSTYEVEQARAQAARWPLLKVEGGHLHFLWAADQVAADVLGLLDASSQA